jgi:hypothetical protein
MATKKKNTRAEKKENAKLMNQIAGKKMLQSSTVNCNVINSLHQNTSFGENDFGEAIKLDIATTREVMEAVSKEVNNGKLSSLEDMLTCQAYSLETLFMTMASKICRSTNAEHIELLSKLALKAQNQCRTTIATLSEMKNPKRAMFVKQLNQASQMQVNNGDGTEIRNQKKTSNPANELLEQTDGERLDTRTTGETIGTNQVMEAVGEVKRS